MLLHVVNFFCVIFVILEVMKVLKAKKHAKSMKTEGEAVKVEKEGSGCETKKGEESDQGKTYQVYLIF